jgi:outer membrane protein assembly factor BamB
MSQDGLGVVAVNDDPSDYPGCVLCYWNHLKDGTPGWGSADSAPVWVYEPGGGPGDTDFYSVVISGSGDYIATGPSYGSFIFSRTNNVPLQTFSFGTANSYALTFDGQYGLCGNRQGGFYYFSKSSGTPLWSKTLGGMVHAVALAYFTEKEWPMFHHDPEHTGYSTSVAPNTNNTIWNYTTGDWIWSSSPTVADGKVYVGSWDNKTYCLNATTGKQIWNYTTGWFVESSPAVAYGRVYVGSYDSKIYCLNDTTGAQIWNYTTGDIVVSSPAVVDDRVYVGSLDNKTYCLNATTGEHIWNYTAGDWVSSSPAVADGRVYIGSGDQKIYCLDASTGAEIWNYTTGNWVSSSPAIIEDRVYVGSADHKIYCLDASTGMHIWNFTTGNYIVSSPAVANGSVYVGSWDHKVYCLDAISGTHIWNYTTGGVIYSSPAVGDGKVYVGSNDRSVYCLNATSGTQIWSYITSGRVVSSPTIAGGKVFVGSEDKKVYAFEDPIYTLSITTSDGGTTDPVPGTYTYYEGTAIAITAISGTGYEFNHWQLDDSWNYSNPIIVRMHANHTLHAVFTYSVTIKAHCYTEDVDVSVSISMDDVPTGYTTPNTFTNLTGTHNFTIPINDLDGHPFKQWDTGDTNTTITVTLGGEHVAYYQGRYNLTITTTAGGTTNPPSGNYTYWDGTHVSVTATPSLGYLLDHWELDTVNVGASNPIVVVMNTNHNLDANFSWVGICNLTITTTTGGTTNPAPGTYSYTNGSVVTVTATPSLGYILSHWELDGSNAGSSNPTAVTMDMNHTLNANYSWVGICSLIISTSPGGTTNPAPAMYSYTKGTMVTVASLPDLGHHFDHWELDGVNAGNQNSITITMNQDHTLHAVFSIPTKYGTHGSGAGRDGRLL